MQIPFDSGVLHRTPPEIWLSIFERATFVPHAFDTDEANPFDNTGIPILFDNLVEERLKASLSAKRSLILVCKLWRELATPLLYQAVIARDNNSLRSLNDALGWHSSASRKLRVRRFDLLRWPADQTLLAADVLGDLFRQLPDLEILHLATYRYYTSAHLDGHDHTRPFDTDEADSLIDTLLAAPVCTTLRKCIIGPSVIHKRQSNVLLSRCTQLCCLFVFADLRQPFREALWQVIPTQSLLTCMSVEHREMHLADLSRDPNPLVPSLRHIHLRLFTLWNGRGVDAVAFLRVQGACLRTVQIDMCGYSGTLKQCLPLFAEHCPNLTHLIFIVDHRTKKNFPLQFTYLPPTVTHLGIYIQDGVYTQDNGGPERTLCEYLQRLHECFEHQDMTLSAVPGVIRRLNPSTEEQWACLRGDAELLARYAALPVPPHCRLEDDQGRDLMSLLHNLGQSQGNLPSGS
ncbi:hypothetical protein EVG20_g9006 [Dentipellis fragilis]|uniref:F-box domain-containing protein n=1 Tax=Dentipellis fragilis TaxID=205917 RepID=A0A4Y9Y2C7_9AGAM|nr:hypothetical protein EVG20_g9006 [Dentipellis fragilis]